MELYLRRPAGRGFYAFFPRHFRAGLANAAPCGAGAEWIGAPTWCRTNSLAPRPRGECAKASTQRRKRCFTQVKKPADKSAGWWKQISKTRSSALKPPEVAGRRWCHPGSAGLQWSRQIRAIPTGYRDWWIPGGWRCCNLQAWTPFLRVP